jgi:desulfoferrodoxin (superoxide reductase-like protein)
VLHVPRVTANGAKVPVRVALDHPMTSDHHVESIEVVNERDPFPSKGTFRLTPANGRAEVAFQIRLSAGTSRVDAIARCSRHGTFSTSRVVEIPDGAGGCTGTAPATTPAAGDLVRPPVIRIAELVERGRIRRGEIVHVQLKMRHPSRTGLGLLDGDFVQASEPFHLVSMEVAYGGERVCTFEMTPALSDDPFVTFALLARRDAPLEVSLVNSRGERFEARHDIRLS